MARPEANTVDYFPHYPGDGKKMFFIEQKYKNDGYATWFKILEKLARTECHYLDLNDIQESMFLSSKCYISEDTLIDIISDLAKLGVFDKELWDLKIIYCQSFIDSIADAYKKRKNKCVDRNSILLLLQSKGIHLPNKSRNKPGKSILSTSENTQSKEKEIKEEKSKEKESEGETEKSVSTHPPEFLKKFEGFNLWLKKNAPEVLKMKKPLTVDEYKKISDQISSKKLSQEIVVEVFTAMGNKPDLVKKYTSAYQTLLSWIRLRKEKEVPKNTAHSSAYNSGRSYGPSSPRVQTQIKEPSPKERANNLMKMLDGLYREQMYVDFGNVLYNRIEKAGLNNHFNDDDARKYAFEMWDLILKQKPESVEFEATETKRLFEFWHLNRVKEMFHKEELMAELIKTI